MDGGARFALDARPSPLRLPAMRRVVAPDRRSLDALALPRMPLDRRPPRGGPGRERAILLGHALSAPGSGGCRAHAFMSVNTFSFRYPSTS